MTRSRFTARHSLLQCEHLETRDCPAVRIGVAGPLLFVIGDRAANTIAITDDGKGTVTATSGTQSVTGTGIRAIRVNAEAGDDNVTYTQTAARTVPLALSIDLGKGNDTGKIDMKAGATAGLIAAEMQGNDGIDTLTVDVGAIAAGVLAAMQVNGGKGDDAITTTFAGALSGLLNLKSSGQDGVDTVNQTMTIDAGSTGRLIAEVRGGKGNDNLTLKISDTASTLAFLSATLDGDEGTDTGSATPNVRLRRIENRV